MHDQAAAHHAVGTLIQCQAARNEIYAGHALRVGPQAGQIPCVVDSGIEAAMGVAGGVEMAARAQAIRAGAIAFLMDMKAMLAVGRQPLNRALNAHAAISLGSELQAAADLAALRGLQLGHGHVAGGRGCGDGCRGGRCGCGRRLGLAAAGPKGQHHAGCHQQLHGGGRGGWGSVQTHGGNLLVDIRAGKVVRRIARSRHLAACNTVDMSERAALCACAHQRINRIKASARGLRTRFRLARVAEQALQGAVPDAEALELIEGCARIVMRAAIDALGLAEDAAIVFGRQLARVIGALTGQRERQRLHRALAGAAGQPAGVIDGIGHLALPQLSHDVMAVVPGNAEHHALATAAGQHAKDQSRILGRAAVDGAPHLQCPVPAKDTGRAAFAEIEIRPPDQRAVAKDPEVIASAPSVQRLVQHGLGLSAGK